MKKGKTFALISIAIIVIASVVMTSVYAINGSKKEAEGAKVSTAKRSRKEIQAERDRIIKKNDDEFGSKPNNKSLDERVAEGQKFKDSLLRLGREEAQLGPVAIDEDKQLSDAFFCDIDAEESTIRGYENDKGLLDDPKNKAAYDIAKKRLDYLKSVKDDYSKGKINAKDAFKRLEKMKDMN